MTKDRSKKRILIICQHFWPETFRINDIADFLANDKDCDVEVLCGIPNYPSGKFTSGYSLLRNRKQTYGKIKIRRAIEVPRGDNSNIRIFLNYVSFPFFSLFHIPRLLTKDYDHIFLYQLSPVMMSITGLIVSRIKKTPSTMYVLDLWPENLYSVLNIKNPLLRTTIEKISHWHYEKTDKIIALSDTMKNRLLEVSGKESKDIIVLPQAAEKIYETSISDTLLINKFSGTFNILFTGNLSPAQSFDTMIDAAMKLKNDGIINIRWIIVGDGMSRKKIESDVKSRGLESIFSFEGQHAVEDIPKYTNIADILVGCLTKSPLLEATIPAKVMSYIASGKPLALAMDGEVQTLINSTIKCGLVGPAGDSDALYRNIKILYTSSAHEREAMGERAKEYHFIHFERNIVLNKMYNFIFS